MKLKGVFSALTLTLATALPLQSHAAPVSPVDLPLDIDGAQILSEHARSNRDLVVGDYAFAQLHEQGSFFDEWKFSLAEDSTVSISLFDLEIPTGSAQLAASFSKSFDEHCGGGSSGMLLDNKYLTFSLFDAAGNLLGASGEDSTLGGLSLAGGQWYTLTVSGKVNGAFGSAYYGDVSVQPVPLGDTLPLFGSALVMLAMRVRRREKAIPAGV